MLAAHPCREIGGWFRRSLLIRDNTRTRFVPLREIAKDETQSADDLRERLIESNQNQIEVDEPERGRDGASLGQTDKPEEGTGNVRRNAAYGS